MLCLIFTYRRHSQCAPLPAPQLMSEARFSVCRAIGVAAFTVHLPPPDSAVNRHARDGNRAVAFEIGTLSRLPNGLSHSI